MDRMVSRSDRFLRLVADSDSIVILLESDATAEEFATAWAVGHLVKCSLGISWGVQGFSPERDGLIGAIAAISGGWLDFASERLPGRTPLLVSLRRGAEKPDQLPSMWPVATLAVGAYSGAQERPSSGAYWDIRPNAFSVAALVANYIREQRVEIDAALASALQTVIDRALANGDGSPLEGISQKWLSRFADDSTTARLQQPSFGPKRLSLLKRCLGGLQECAGIAVAEIDTFIDAEFLDDVAALAAGLPLTAAALVVGPSERGTALRARSRPRAEPEIDAFMLLRSALTGVGSPDASIWGNARRAAGFSPQRLADIAPGLRKWLSTMTAGDLAQKREHKLGACGEVRLRPIK